MIKMLLVICVVLSVMAIGAFVVSAEDLKPGDMAPDFSVMTYAGTVTTLSDYRDDKDVVLVFYRGHW